MNLPKGYYWIVCQTQSRIASAYGHGYWTPLVGAIDTHPFEWLKEWHEKSVRDRQPVTDVLHDRGPDLEIKLISWQLITYDEFCAALGSYKLVNVNGGR